MRRLSRHMCPQFQTAVDLLGRRWTGLVLRALSDGPRRFGDLSEHLEVVSERVLSERLKELTAEGLVERRVSTSPPVQVEYRLTEKGLAFRGVLDALGAWAERWVSACPSEKRARET
ncbi:MAG TPA: helix-turn-helix domain-containing protein [Myxococcaceae bacterium]|nr:helix-turn-helix domain-containing protein [Myxococcaceae bacterium]